VGLSRGITPALTPLGKLTIVAVMFLGRVGPITMATAIFMRERPAAPDQPGVDDLAV
jgi:Trk-type K+ transport system membrane component